jgi:hypothetical protein
MTGSYTQERAVTLSVRRQQGIAVCVAHINKPGDRAPAGNRVNRRAPTAGYSLHHVPEASFTIITPHTSLASSSRVRHKLDGQLAQADVCSTIVREGWSSYCHRQHMPLDAGNPVGILPQLVQPWTMRNSESVQSWPALNSSWCPRSAGTRKCCQSTRCARRRRTRSKHPWRRCGRWAAYAAIACCRRTLSVTALSCVYDPVIMVQLS